MAILQWIYRFRGALASPVLVFALVSFSRRTDIPWLIWPLGSGLFVVGLLLRIWAQQHVRYRLRVAKCLTTTGPYAFVRNPIYIGNTLICLGMTVASELLWLVPVALAYCMGLYSLIVRYEEACLFEQYGESYRSYLVAVPRWFPRTIRVSDPGLVNEYLRASVVAEMHCWLFLAPYLLKEAVSWMV